MLTINKIIDEIKNVPLERLEEVYQFVNSLNPDIRQKEILRKKNLSFAGTFSDMSEKDYKDFKERITKTRGELFNRSF